MTPTQKLIEAAEAAVEALTNCASEHGHRCNRCDSEVDEGGRVAEALRTALQGLREAQAEPVAGVHWYCLAATGTAMLCTDEEDARHEAAECDRLYPMHAPHRAVQLVPATPPTTDAPAQWQPIETAPKDGTHILLSDGERVSVGAWASDMDYGADYEGQLGVATWWAVDLGPNNDRPTLWMPLPAAPTQEGAPK